MASNSTSTLQSLLQGEPLPDLPGWQMSWTLYEYKTEIEIFHRKLLDYIRRLMGALTGVNIVNEIINETDVDGLVADWQYNTTTHKFQVKRITTGGVIGAWEDTSGGQPVSVSNLTDWQYDATSNTFQYKTRAEYVLEAAAASSFGNSGGSQPTTATDLTDWKYDTSTHKFQYKTQVVGVLKAASVSSFGDVASGGQPTSFTKLVRNVDWDTGTHILEQDVTADVYVLEKGSNTDDQNIDTAEACA